jgi:HD-GYP domain-containing protein (c-di-GMP phosphodiesterase class II)
MTSDRSYRQAMSEEVALAELAAGSGSQFDTDIVAAFLRIRARSIAGVVAAARPRPPPIATGSHR